MITTINNKHKKLNVPNLRFPKFEGEWEKMRLDAFTERVMRKPKSVIMMSLCRTAKRNPLIFPI